ncbi:MAG: hypothetical protein ACYDC8_17575, partial [Gammaproteobacteria bacterium]
RELPVLWFSENQIYELTATKLLVDGVTRCKRMATIAEMTNVTLTGGLFRFRYEGDDLIPWPELAAAARIPRVLAKDLEERAQQIGAVPKEWSGSLAAMPIDGMSIEFAPEFGVWIPVTLADVRTIAGITASIPQGNCNRDGVTVPIAEYKTA